MQTFISQTSLFNNTVIRSKHERNAEEEHHAMSLFELNNVNSIVFRFALANYVCLTSLADLIARIDNGWPPVTRPHLVNAFAITEIRTAYYRNDIDELYHIQEYLHTIADIGTQLGLVYQDQFAIAENRRVQNIAGFIRVNDGIAIPNFVGRAVVDDDSDDDSDDEWFP